MSLRLHTYTQLPVRTPSSRIKVLFDEITDEEADPDWRGSVNLVFADDAALQKLNRLYRRKNSATDVLSFNIDSPRNDDNVFGEIYISIDTARRQAKEYQNGLFVEILRLFCHGLLHLLGYDHQSESQRRRMRKRERYYLAKAGVRIQWW